MAGSEGITNGSRDVVAVMQGRDLELLPVFPRPLGKLPNEVLLMIFRLFNKSDLKAVRCACKFFVSLVSRLLFDKIYISPHRQNMEVFRQITEHSDLCRYPRKLVYDIQTFKANIDLREYFETLCDQLTRLSHGSGSEIHHADKEIESLLRMVQDRPCKYEGYSTYRVVQRGLEIYREKAEEEDHYNSGQLFGCLCIGLMKLPCLDKVEFQVAWRDQPLSPVDWSNPLQDLRIFSSPLARTWSPFHLTPEAPIMEANTVHEFDNVISAFALTKRPLRILNGGCLVSVPYEIFYTNSRLSRTFRQHSRAAMCSLEYLDLQVDPKHYSTEDGSSDPEHEPKEKTLSVDLLAAALVHMPRLKHLSLCGGIQKDGNGLLSISELFQAVRLPALQILELCAMLGSAADILAFLRAQPRLRRLELSTIELSEGTWAGLVDDMRRRLPLESAVLVLPLRHGGGVDLWDIDAWVEEDMAVKIEDYILHGGKNPLRVPE